MQTLGPEIEWFCGSLQTWKQLAGEKFCNKGLAGRLAS